MLLKTLRIRFSKWHLLTQFYVHHVLYSQTKETEVTKYPFVQGVRKHCYIWSFVPEKLRTAVVDGYQMKTQIYFQLQATLGPPESTLQQQQQLPPQRSTDQLGAAAAVTYHPSMQTPFDLGAESASGPSCALLPPNHRAVRREGEAAPPASKGAAPCRKRVARPREEQPPPLLHAATASAQDWTQEGGGGTSLLAEGGGGGRLACCLFCPLQICSTSLPQTHQPGFPFIASGNSEWARLV